MEGIVKTNNEKKRGKWVMEGHSGQKCNLIATCIPLDRIRVSLDRTFLPLDRTFLPLDRTFLSIASYLSSIRSYFDYFVASYMTLVYSSVVFHIYPYLRGNSIPSDRNYHSAVVTIWSAVKRGRLNLDLVLVWRHTTYDYMTYN